MPYIWHLLVASKLVGWMLVLDVVGWLVVIVKLAPGGFAQLRLTEPPEPIKTIDGSVVRARRTALV